MYWERRTTRTKDDKSLEKSGCEQWIFGNLVDFGLTDLLLCFLAESFGVNITAPYTISQLRLTVASKPHIIHAYVR